METIKMNADFTGDTKRKHRYSAEVLGISIGIYIDKLAQIPDRLVINLTDEAKKEED